MVLTTPGAAFAMGKSLAVPPSDKVRPSSFNLRVLTNTDLVSEP
jgi:hypothetical protein